MTGLPTQSDLAVPGDRLPALAAATPDEVRADQIRLAYAQSHAGFFATYLSIVLILFLVGREIPANMALVWCIFALAVTTLRYALVRFFRDAHAPAARMDAWERHFVWASALGGLVYGLGAGLILFTPSLLHQVFLLFVIGGMAAGAVATLGSILAAYRAYVILALLPASLVLLLGGNETQKAMGALFLVYLAFLLRAARNYNASVTRALALRAENQELVHTLSVAKERTEQINLDLKRDQQQRHRIEEALSQEKERAQITLASIGDGVITADVDGFIEYMNPIAVQLTGWSLQEARSQHLDTLLVLVDETTRTRITGLFLGFQKPRTGTSLQSDILLVHRSGKMEFSIEVTASPIRDHDDQIVGLVLVFHDVTELRGMARQMTYQATHDSLTGLINRREFETRLELALRNARSEDKQHALMYVDLDQFKIVNDTCGHVAGDELLKQIAILLQQRVRGNDSLARLGGDEFGVLLHTCPLDRALIVAEEMRQTLKEFRFAWQGRIFDVGASIGLAPISTHNRDTSELLSAADAACYVAKDGGRNRVHVYLPDDETIVRRHGEMQWIPRIKQALADERFRLYYQSVVPIGRGSRDESYCEFLLRMLDEHGNLVKPMVFIPAAERYQLMPIIDRWVVATVLESLARPHVVLDGFGICAINLSGQSLCDDNFLDFVLTRLADHHVPPEKICFEITETAAIANFQRASEFIAHLRRMGCRFALDDFGSGVSSFAYLKALDVDFLKIDGDFVKDMADDAVDYSLVEAVNRIGHVMGKKTIAEFVESAAILAKLDKLKVDYAQGFGIQRPRPL